MKNQPRDLTAVVPENSVRFLGHDTHSHPVPHLIHVVTGSADLVVDGQPFRLWARENLWLAPEVPHSARYAPGSIVLGPFLSPETVPTQRFQRLGVVPQLTQMMSTALGAAPTGEQIKPFRQALDELLQAMTGHHFFSLPLPAHPAARAVARGASTRLTLDELAVAQGTSVRHIQRLFQVETGCSFSQWRTRARLNVAIARLRGGDSLTVAAHIAGYATRGSLLKALSRETGHPERRLARDPITVLDSDRHNSDRHL